MEKLKTITFLIVILTFTHQLSAQSFGSMTNADAGKCFRIRFDYEKKCKLEEVDCKTLHVAHGKKTKEELLKRDQARAKMRKYQEKLKTLGYDVDIVGFIDDKTMTAHNKYLRKKKKAERKKRRSEKRKR